MARKRRNQRIRNSELTPVESAWLKKNDDMPGLSTEPLRSMLGSSSGSGKDQSEEELTNAIKELTGSMDSAKESQEKYSESSMEMFKKIQSRGLESRIDKAKAPMFGKEKFEQTRARAYETIDKYAEGGFKNPQLKRQALDEINSLEKMGAKSNRSVAGMAIGATVAGSSVLSALGPELARDYRTTRVKQEVQTTQGMLQAGGTVVGAAAGTALFGPGAGTAAGAIVGGAAGGMASWMYTKEEQKGLDIVENTQNAMDSAFNKLAYAGIKIPDDMRRAMVAQEAQAYALVGSDKEKNRDIIDEFVKHTNIKELQKYKKYEEEDYGWENWLSRKLGLHYK